MFTSVLLDEHFTRTLRSHPHGWGPE